MKIYLASRLSHRKRAKLTQPLVVRMFGPRMTVLQYEGEGRAMLVLSERGKTVEVGEVNLEL